MNKESGLLRIISNHLNDLSLPGLITQYNFADFIRSELNSLITDEEVFDLGKGFTSIVVGTYQYAIKVYMPSVVKKSPNLCNDYEILKRLQHFNFVPKLHEGKHNKFIITNRIETNHIDFKTLAVEEFNKIFINIVKIHLAGIYVNDLHIKNIIYCKEKQDYIFIDVGAFSLEGYHSPHSNFEIEEFIDVPTPAFVLVRKSSLLLWENVYAPLIKRINNNIPVELDFEALNNAYKPYIQLDKVNADTLLGIEIETFEDDYSDDITILDTKDLITL